MSKWSLTFLKTWFWSKIILLNDNEVVPSRANLQGKKLRIHYSYWTLFYSTVRLPSKVRLLKDPLDDAIFKIKFILLILDSIENQKAYSTLCETCHLRLIKYVGSRIKRKRNNSFCFCSSWLLQYICEPDYEQQPTCAKNEQSLAVKLLMKCALCIQLLTRNVTILITVWRVVGIRHYKMIVLCLGYIFVLFIAGCSFIFTVLLILWGRNA